VVFELPIYREPDFSGEPFQSFPDAVLVPVAKPGVAPENYHATTIYPEYIKVGGRWLLACESRMDCVIVVHDGEGLEVKEFRRLAGRACRRRPQRGRAPGHLRLRERVRLRRRREVR